MDPPLVFGTPPPYFQPPPSLDALHDVDLQGVHGGGFQLLGPPPYFWTPPPYFWTPPLIFGPPPPIFSPPPSLDALPDVDLQGVHVGRLVLAFGAAEIRQLLGGGGHPQTYGGGGEKWGGGWDDIASILGSLGFWGPSMGFGVLGWDFGVIGSHFGVVCWVLGSIDGVWGHWFTFWGRLLGFGVH